MEQWLNGTAVVMDYIETGGQNVTGGGLPSLQLIRLDLCIVINQL
jgi:hypothetical protein